jgi:hypothetical protein
MPSSAERKQVIRIAIPALALLVALRLYVKKPAAYLSFTMWVWFLTPLVRRLVDWQWGWTDPNLILLSPLLVSSVGILSILAPSRIRKLEVPPAIFFCVAGVLYGFVIGILMHPSAEVVFGLLNWLSPLLLGLHVALDWRNYEQNKATVMNSFVWGAGVLGIYGLYQFFVAPPWDAFWLQNVTSGLTDPSFGRPEPMMIRTWSTLNAPGPFAGVMSAALLVLIVSRSRWKVPISIVGFSSFLLSAVRAAWLGYVIGLILLLRRLSPKSLIRVLASMLAVASCMVPIILYSFGSAKMDIVDRLKSLAELKQDASFREREDMYRAITAKILHEPFGTGLQNQQVVQNLPVDSGILATLLSLGWLGALLYLLGVALTIWGTGRVKSQDSFVLACRAVCLSGLAQYVGANIFVGLGSAVFWICASSTVASTRWEQQQMSIAPPASFDLGESATPNGSLSTAEANSAIA